VLPLDDALVNINIKNKSVPPEKRDYAIAEFNAKSAKVRIFMRGPHFFQIRRTFAA